MKRAIVWFRRDLRLHDHPALAAALAEAEEVIPVYIVSDWAGTHGWTGPNRQSFLCGALEELAEGLRLAGGRLVIRRGDAIGELEKLAAESGSSAVFFHRDPDPFGRSVEKRLDHLAERTGLVVKGFDSTWIHRPGTVLTGTGQPFRVFTPFSRAWWKLPRSAAPIPPPLRVRLPSEPLNSLDVPSLASWRLGHPGSGVPHSGEQAARRRLMDFLENRLPTYGSARDLPAAGGTSRISQDLRFGLLSPREVFTAAESRMETLAAAGRDGARQFLNEIIWREFAMHVLWHFPAVLDGPFQPKYRDLRWPGSDASFARWRAGETGFPLVDAGMRELLETGLMHNRIRMVVAMFLTKDLHVDWRMGERHFLQHLVDGEIASNNGGWQWCAGTGADAAPYFRIQNPWTQTARHDPEGLYIKRWIPELRDVPPGKFLAPPASGLSPGYPSPIVDHAAERLVTLELFRYCGAGSGSD